MWKKVIRVTGSYVNRFVLFQAEFHIKYANQLHANEIERHSYIVDSTYKQAAPLLTTQKRLKNYNRTLEYHSVGQTSTPACDNLKRAGQDQPAYVYM